MMTKADRRMYLHRLEMMAHELSLIEHAFRHGNRDDRDLANRLDDARYDMVLAYTELTHMAFTRKELIHQGIIEPGPDE